MHLRILEESSFVTNSLFLCSVCVLISGLDGESSPSNCLHFSNNKQKGKESICKVNALLCGRSFKTIYLDSAENTNE